MVKGKGQPAKSQTAKKSTAGNNRQPTATVSPAQPGIKVKAPKPGVQAPSVPSCSACGIYITDDVKALQCDRCQSNDRWKCADCLNIPPEMYDHLVSDPNCSLRWFCIKCDKSAMDIANTTHDHGSEKLDNLIGLVEKLLDKVAAVDEKMKDKCDVETVKHLETRIGTLEDRALQTEQDIGSKLSSLELKLQQQLDDRVSKSTVCDRREELGIQERVQMEVDKKLDQDKDIERRKRNLIIYRVAEVNSDIAADRNASDLAFITELLDTVFQIQPDSSGIVKSFRLGRRDSTKDSPRPLLVEFDSHEAKERVMSNLTKLKNVKAPFKGISLAHDMSPWQRTEMKRLVEQAKHEHTTSNNAESVENFYFRVVGSGSRMRVIKIRKQSRDINTVAAS